MKKYLLPIALIALLVSCSGTRNNSVTPSSNILNSSEENSSVEESSTSNEDSTLSTSEKDTTSEQTPEGAKKKTVTFKNGGFTNSSLNQAASQTQFVNWFNNGDNVLKSIGYEGYAQLNYIGNEGDTWRFSTLILGSGNSEGKLTFNLNVNILNIKVAVQSYAKYIEYNSTYSIDRSATFYIDKEEYDLSVADDFVGDTENKTIEQSFVDGTTSFSIANKEAKQRVFVHSMEITYLD